MNILKNIKAALFLLCLVCLCKINCMHEPLPLGNFALCTPLEPGPLFCFGQNIVDKNDLLLIEDYFYQQISGLKYNILTSSILYGITDNLSVLFNVPIIVDSRQGDCKSAGLSDIFVQGEYAFFNYGQETYYNQATIVAAMSLPTGSNSKTPQLGLGSPSFFIGATASHTSIKWYAFCSLGGLFTTSSWNIKQGNQLFYEAGLGYNLGYKTKKWLLTGILELSSLYAQPDKIDGFFDNNTRSNVIFFGPLLFFSYKCITLQAGFQGAIFQDIKDNQHKENLRTALEIAFIF
jgi:hypothetical protein